MQLQPTALTPMHAVSSNTASSARISHWLPLLCVLLFTAVHGAQLEVAVTNASAEPLANAVVYLLPKTPPASLPPPHNAEIDQKDRTFVPLVSVIQTGAMISFPNSDNIRHQVYSFSPAKIFKLKLYSGRSAEPVLFDKPGVVVMGCNIHDQMVAWLLVVDTPWFGVTGADGKIRIATVPNGDYSLVAWHPNQRVAADPVDIKLVGEMTKSLSVDAKPIDTAHVGHGAPGG
jgi:plastocyanin